MTVALGTSMPTSMTVVATSTSASPAAKRAIASAFSRGRIWPCSRTTRSSRELGACAAARTRPWRRAPAAPRTPRRAGRRRTPGARRAAPRGCARRPARARARPRRRASSIGRRPLRQLAQRRDVELAVAQQRAACAGSASRSCAARAAPAPCRALRVQRRALAHAEAVLLVDDGDGEAVEDDRRPRSARGCPTTSASSPVPSLPSRSARRAAGVEPVSSAAGTASPGMSACSVAKCCSASVSVGAISAACRPCSTARSIACSATTVLPEPTSPMSRRCIGRARARSASTSLDRRALVAGRRERQQLAAATRRLSCGAPSSTRRRERLAAVRAPAQLDELVEQQLVEGQPPPAALAVAEVRRGDAPRGGRAGARRRAGAPGSGSGTSAIAVAVARARARGSAWRSGPSSPGSGRPPRSAPAASSVGAWRADAEAVARLGTCRAASAASPAGTCPRATAG